jgi:hypothetical protein
MAAAPMLTATRMAQDYLARCEKLLRDETQSALKFVRMLEHPAHRLTVNSPMDPIGSITRGR